MSLGEGIRAQGAGFAGAVWSWGEGVGFGIGKRVEGVCLVSQPITGTLHPETRNQNPGSITQHPKTPNNDDPPKPETPNPNPQTPNPRPHTLNPIPHQLNYEGMDEEHRQLLSVIRESGAARKGEPTDQLVLRAQVLN